jgi:Middle or third domain of peptidase_M16
VLFCAVLVCQSDKCASRGPQAAVFLGFAMPAAYTSPEAAVLTKLFARLLADALNELAYPASLAGAVVINQLAHAGLRIPEILLLDLTLQSCLHDSSACLVCQGCLPFSMRLDALRPRLFAPGCVVSTQQMGARGSLGVDAVAGSHRPPLHPAGLQYALDSTTQGFQLTASGLSHKLPELVHTVLAKLADLRVAEDRFEVGTS